MKIIAALDLYRVAPRLIIAMATGVLPLMLGACATLDEPVGEQAAYRGPVTAGEVKDALARGVPQAEILDQIRRRGARPPSSMEIDQLRLAGADHSVIDGLLKANHATQYVWVNPPRFSFYWGRGSWYWVNDYGWPVYPQPWGWVPDSPRFYGPQPGYPFPIKPSPRPKVSPQVGITEDNKTGKDKAKPEVVAPAAPVSNAAPNGALNGALNGAAPVAPNPAQNARPSYIPKNEK